MQKDLMMIEAYLELIDQTCAVEVVAQIKAVDLAGQDADGAAYQIYRGLRKDKSFECLSSFVGYVAYNATRKTHVEVMRLLLDAAASLKPNQRAGLRDAMKRAYENLPYRTSESSRYFATAALFDLRIDEALNTRLSQTPFNDHTDEAFDHARYLVITRDPTGVDKFASTLERLHPNVDQFVNVYIAFTDLIVLFHRESRDASMIWPILERYKNDKRATTGVNGPQTGASAFDIYAANASAFRP